MSGPYIHSTTPLEPRLYTVHITTKVKWWKVPYYILRDRPIKTTVVYKDVELESMVINADESVLIVGNGRDDATI